MATEDYTFVFTNDKELKEKLKAEQDNTKDMTVKAEDIPLANYAASVMKKLFEETEGVLEEK